MEKMQDRQSPIAIFTSSPKKRMTKEVSNARTDCLREQKKIWLGKLTNIEAVSSKVQLEALMILKSLIIKASGLQTYTTLIA
jgi:hypothetical protein